jgi:hypothetical protein
MENDERNPCFQSQTIWPSESKVMLVLVLNWSHAARKTDHFSCLWLALHAVQSPDELEIWNSNLDMKSHGCTLECLSH